MDSTWFKERSETSISLRSWCRDGEPDYALERLESYFNIKNEMVLESKSSLLITAHKVPGVVRAIQEKEG
uniref:(California timema) hypothetical protein n=1 Tax=Timema californicum TaxID=61474 RepID=A0A7R9JAQ6_TIMCA|nr:unnamed protein product [Timema californicum]